MNFCPMSFQTSQNSSRSSAMQLAARVFPPLACLGGGTGGFFVLGQSGEATIYKTEL
jgi:hypothetical protein